MTLYIPTIPMPDLGAQAAARGRIQARSAARPFASLGILDGLGVRLAAMRGTVDLSFPRKGVVVMAADYAQHDSVAAQVVALTQESAAVNVLARQAGATVTVVDVGLRGELPQRENIGHYRVAEGARDMVARPALTLQEVTDAVMVGMNVASLEIVQEVDLLAVGGVGAGGIEAAAAVTAVITGALSADLVDDQAQIGRIEQAIDLHEPEPRDALDVLRCVGGLEIAGLAGVILGAAAGRVPVVLDGFVSCAAALIASELAFQVRPYLLAGHGGVEKGQRSILQRLGLRPLLDLEMGAGNGSGAVLAFHLVEAAVRTLGN